MLPCDGRWGANAVRFAGFIGSGLSFAPLKG